MTKRESGGFPSDLGEAEYEVELILEHAEGLNRLPYKEPEEAKEWGPWIRMIRWLEPQIEQYGYLPESKDDINFFTPGWQQDLASLYVLLINHSYGATWESGDEQGRLNAKIELTGAILKIKTSLEDVKSYKQAKSTPKATAGRIKKSKEREQKVLMLRAEHVEKGTPGHEIASKIERATGVSADTVRRIFRKNPLV